MRENFEYFLLIVLISKNCVRKYLVKIYWAGNFKLLVTKLVRMGESGIISIKLSLYTIYMFLRILIRNKEGVKHQNKSTLKFCTSIAYSDIL